MKKVVSYRNIMQYCVEITFGVWAKQKQILEIVIQIVKIQNAEEIGH